MDEYRKHVSEIHAPESLINTTLERIHEEQQTTITTGYSKKRKKSNIVKFAVPVMAAAAAALIVVTQLPSENTLTYNTVPDMAFRTGDISIDFGTFEEKKEISAEEYSDYLGVEVEALFEGMELTKADIEVRYDTKGRMIIEDESTLHYQSAEGKIVLECSRTKDMIPDVLKQEEVSSIAGNELWLAINEQESILTAAGEVNEVSYCIRAEGMDKKQFEKIMKNFFKKM